MKSSNEKKIFQDNGPSLLTNLDWSEPDQRKSVAASLVKGVYIRERGRQKQRHGVKALAQTWWEFFNFQHILDLHDIYDGSIFGCIFKYTPENPTRHYHHKPPESRPPMYVMALRGTLLKWRTFFRDGYLDLKCMFNPTKHSTRYQTSLDALQDIIRNVGPENVWLAGHSLGAAIALQVGKSLAIEGCYIDSYLFNPPYVSVPIEKIHNRKLKTGIRVFKSLLTVGVHVALKDNTKQHNNETFRVLSKWTPYLFVNQQDPICCEYIGDFEHREKMESWGLGFIEKIASQKSLVSLILGSYGKECECEANHLIPSAFIIKNLYQMKNEFRVAHGLDQWWARHECWETKRYEFDADGS